MVATSRECGDRVEGGCYIEVATGSSGRPLEEFLLDPPVVVPEDVDLSARGMNVLRLRPDGPYHLIDVVGQDNYPNVADVLEEGRRLGFSRRIQSTAKFDLLTPESLLILVHARGFIENFEDYYKVLEDANPTPNDSEDNWKSFWTCPKRLPNHSTDYRPHTLSGVFDEMCAGLWWVDLYEGTMDSGCETLHRGLPSVLRKMKHVTYTGAARPFEIEPVYKPAMIASLPIGRIAVVKAEDGSHKRNVDKARKGRIQVDEVDA